MNLHLRYAAVSLLALSCSTAALAEDEPVYEASPDWVVPVDMDQVERDPANDRIVSDTQIRIEEGLLWRYTDVIYRVSSLSNLTEVGTLKAQWMPDKGDLIVHRIAILRDGETIDLVEAGERLEVLRREQQLESHIIDGELTATLSVPGLRVGDELQMAYSVTRSDQALGREVQSQSYLWREPSTAADYARVLVSWPEDLDVRYQAGPNYEIAPADQRGGHNWLEVALPLPEAEDLPQDAPARFLRSTFLQVGTFDDWAEVSSVMAPYYGTEGALDGLDDLQVKVEKIRGDHDTELARAVAALELVQEDIRYLLNGLDGGNYIPQDVATTWEKKYGDCKAKTLILLALLDQLGIEAEPVLASVNQSNSVPVSLPLPGAFDHVLVRATIDGNHYYLDGTSLGANITIAGNVPPFEYVLPLRAEGADLEPIVQVLPRVPESTFAMTVDASAGGDIPSLVEISVKFVGAAAAQLNAHADKLNDDAKRQLARNAGSEGAIVDVEIVAGEDDSVATMIMSGVMPPMFDYDGLRGEFEPAFATTEVEFSPDRSRRDWREIPVSVEAASAAAFNLNVVLPKGTDGFELRGDTSLDEVVAGQRLQREIRISDGMVAVEELITSQGGEIAADQITAERRKAQSFSRNEVKLIAPEGMPRRWRFAQSADRSELAAIEATYAKAIANDPEEAAPYLTRAGFRYDTYDFAGSLEDMNTVIELEGTAEYHAQRSTVHLQLRDLDAAVEDLTEAFLLQPTPWRAMNLAGILLENGNAAEARELLEGEDGDEEVRQSLAVSLAELDAYAGDGKAGLARIDLTMEDDPNNAYMMNQKCWFMGTWQVEVREAIDVCTKAVELGGKAEYLDSRAMVYYRNGMFEEALADLDAALDRKPEMNGSLLLRGVILREQGDAAGQKDIDAALARDPMLASSYGLFGFEF